VPCGVAICREEDRVVRIAVPLCCAYLSFFVGENVLEGSGVIACVFSGEYDHLIRVIDHYTYMYVI
jgi:NhaP-type Na+/H+ or K+/H+ antiporter